MVTMLPGDTSDLYASLAGDPLDIEGLDAGIRETVKLLCKEGFRTCDSGDGYSKEGTELEGCMLGFPHVAMVTTPYTMIEESERLLNLLTDLGVNFDPKNPPVIDPEDPPENPHIEASYSPVDGVAILMLSNVDDRMLGLPKQEKKC